MSVEGRIGEAARRVGAVLASHFEKEEAYVLPAVGLLRALVSDRVRPPHAHVAYESSERLRSELPKMQDEHRQIRFALGVLSATARSENRVDIAEFAERLAVHTAYEEEVLYPAALLVGEFLNLKKWAYRDY